MFLCGAQLHTNGATCLSSGVSQAQLAADESLNFLWPAGDERSAFPQEESRGVLTCEEVTSTHKLRTILHSSMYLSAVMALGLSMES